MPDYLTARAEYAEAALSDSRALLAMAFEVAAKLGWIVGFLGEDEARIAALREACGPDLLRRARAAFDKGGEADGHS